jgi:hypothetical protein
MKTRVIGLHAKQRHREVPQHWQELPCLSGLSFHCQLPIHSETWYNWLTPSIDRWNSHKYCQLLISLTSPFTAVNTPLITLGGSQNATVYGSGSTPGTCIPRGAHEASGQIRDNENSKVVSMLDKASHEGVYGSGGMAQYIFF